MASTDITLTMEQWKRKVTLVWEIGFDDGMRAADELLRKHKVDQRIKGRKLFEEEFDALNG